MADAKISDLTALTGANVADDDEFVIVDTSAAQSKRITRAELAVALGTNDTLADVLGKGNATGGTDIAVSSGDDITFADSSKAIFGAGSDLQIYHDGSASYVQDIGTGDLRVLGNNLKLANADNTENYIHCTTDGQVQIYYDNSTKLATTSTGVDVTGTVTSDGLTVENTSGSTVNINTNLAAQDSKILLHEGTTASPANGASIRYAGATNEFYIGVGSSVDTKRFSIGRDTGDISFYDSTGTSQNLFWDASASALGIGTTSPTTALEVTSTTGIKAGRSGGASITMTAGSTGEARIDTSIMSRAFQVNSGGSISLKATTGLGAGALNIDSSGLVGIGTATPASALDVTGTATVDGLTVDSGATSTSVTITSLGNAAPGNSGSIDFYRTNAGHNTVQIVDTRSADVDGGNLVIRTSDTAGTMLDRMLVGQGGDISFYDSTGTSQNLFWDASASRLGIGTTSPGTIIDARETSTGGSTQIRVYNTDNSNTTTQTAALFLSPDSRGNGALIFAEKENADFSTSAGRDVSLVFSPVLNNSQTERMRLDSLGRLGVNNSAPSYTLDVTGDINFTGTLYENGVAFSGGGASTLSDVLSGGNTTGGSNIVFGDSSGASDDRLTFGASADLQIYHDGSHSFITDVGTGNLELQTDGIIKLQKGATEYLAQFNVDGAVQLYYDNSQKLETTSTGATITNNLGVGTTATTASSYNTLHIGANTIGSILRLEGATAGFYHRIINQNGDMLIQADQGNSKASTNMIFYTDGTERARIDTSGNLKFNSGYGSVATGYGVRAWCKYDGNTNTIDESGNISSVTDNATGKYTFNFSSSFPDTNYIHVSGTTQDTGEGRPRQPSHEEAQTYSTSAFSLWILDGTSFQDTNYVSVAFIR